MFSAHYKVRRDLTDTGRVDVVLSSIVVKNKEVLQRFLVCAVSSECLTLRRSRQYIKPSAHWECTITNVKGRGRRTFWKDMLFFHNQQGCKIFFNLGNLFSASLAMQDYFSLHFGFARFFSCLWTPHLAPLHISNGAFLTSS